jgi:hypothetical protein
VAAVKYLQFVRLNGGLPTEESVRRVLPSLPQILPREGGAMEQEGAHACCRAGLRDRGARGIGAVALRCAVGRSAAHSRHGAKTDGWTATPWTICGATSRELVTSVTETIGAAATEHLAIAISRPQSTVRIAHSTTSWPRVSRGISCALPAARDDTASFAGSSSGDVAAGHTRCASRSQD